MKKALNILLWIMLGVTVALVAYAIQAEHLKDNPAEFDASIHANMMWGYVLGFGAIAVALLNTVIGWIKNPSGIVGSLLTLGLVVVVVVASWFVASGHSIEIVDLQNNGVFPHTDTVITEASIFVTYVAGGLSVVAAIFTEVWSFFK